MSNVARPRIVNLHLCILSKVSRQIILHLGLSSDGEIEIDPEQFKGCQMRVVVRERDFEGRLYSEVVRCTCTR